MSDDMGRCAKEHLVQNGHWAKPVEREVEDLLSSLVSADAGVFEYDALLDRFCMLKRASNAAALEEPYVWQSSHQLLETLRSDYPGCRDWEQTRAFLAHDHMASSLNDGLKRSISIPVGSSEVGQDWIRLTITPSTLSQQRAFLLIECMDRRERLYPIFELYLKSTSDQAFLLDLKKGSYIKFVGGEDGGGSLPQESYDYWGVVLRYIDRRVPNAERDTVKRRMNPEFILHVLHSESEYSFIMSVLGEQGESRSEQVSYRALDLERGYVLLRLKDVTDIRVKEQMLEQAQHESVTDPLTQVNNRRGSESKIREALLSPERSRESALALLDLDNFKDVNDRFGHPEGDCVLQEAARRLQGCFRAEDIVGRLGGDEFIVFLHNIAGLDNLHAVLERVIHALRIDCGNESERAVVTVSVGAALCGDKTYEELYREVDRALYQAKRTKNSYSIYGETA